MVKKQKIASPKNRKDFEKAIRDAFLAGCVHGYSVEHTIDMEKQETLGAKLYLGVKLCKNNLMKKLMN